MPSTAHLADVAAPNPGDPAREPSGSRAVSFWAIVDQFVFSGTNFLTSVILGRIAGPTELGKYALSFSVLMIVIGIQRSLLMSPYVIVRSRWDESGQREMRGSLLVMTFVIAGIFSLLCLGMVPLGSTLSGTFSDPWMRIATAVAFPSGMLRDFGRRLAIYHLDIGRAMWLDIITMLGQFATLTLLYSLGEMNAPMVLIGCSCVWSAVGLMGLIVSRNECSINLRSLRIHFADLWPIGRWVSLTQIVATTQAFVMPWVMAIAASVKLAGIYAACWTIVQIVSPIIEGLGNLIGPKMAGSAERKSWSGIYRLMVNTSMAFAGIMFCLFVLLLIAGRFTLDQLYGSEYAEYFSVLVVLAIAATTNNLGIPVLKALIQLGHAKVNFFISFAGLAVTISSSTWLLNRVGPAGAAWGLVIGNTLATSARWVLIHRVNRDVASAAQSSYVARGGKTR